jgi:hypothetical protein
MRSGLPVGGTTTLHPAATLFALFGLVLIADGLRLIG